MKIIPVLGAAVTLCACATTGAPSRDLSWSAPDGAWVLGQWKDGAYYPGVVKPLSSGRYVVRFDDGTEATLRANQIRPYEWQPGALIACEVVDGRMDPVTIALLGPGATDLTLTDQAGATHATVTGRCRAL